MKREKQSKTVPLTRALLERTASKAGRLASESAMKTAGYVIKVENDWIVREEASGITTKISEITKSKRTLNLD